MNSVTEKQKYYKQLIKYLIREFYQVKASTPKTFKNFFSSTFFDMLFELPPEKCSSQLASPFPFFTQCNLLVFQEKLSKNIFQKRLGELYLFASETKIESQKLLLLILLEEEPSWIANSNSLHQLESTKLPFIKKIKADFSAYLLILENIPIDANYWYFLPFLPLKKLKKEKQLLLEMLPLATKNSQLQRSFLWLSKFQTEFYQKEIPMPFSDKKEIALDFFPNAIHQANQEGIKQGKKERLKEDILHLIQLRFEESSSKISGSLNKIDSFDKLHLLFEKAALIQNLNEFEILLELNPSKPIAFGIQKPSKRIIEYTMILVVITSLLIVIVAVFGSNISALFQPEFSSKLSLRR